MKIQIRLALVLTLFIGIAASVAAPVKEGTLVGDFLTPDPDGFIPVALKGFTGETKSVLTFDLEIAGFKLVAENAANVVISGKNSDVLEGTVVDRTGAMKTWGKRYTGGSARVQAHTFADEIVKALTGVDGVARTKIVFKVDTNGAKELYISDYDGHNPVRVTSDKSIVAAPTWVPGKFALYYTSYMRQNPDIYYHDLSSGKRLTIARHSGLNTSPAVSPDGSKICMILSKGGSPDVYVADKNGNDLKRLTKTTNDESSPCWSPDGQQICFTSRESGRARLYTIPAYGGKMVQLQTSGVSTVTEPDWSPDGKRIVFTSQYRSGFNICTIPAAGGTAKVISDGEDPSWAPNSRTVIITRRVGGKRVLSLLDVETKHVKDIRQAFAGSCSQACWAK